MKFKCLWLLLAALTLGVNVRADLASIFTNVAPVALAPRPSIILIQCHGLARGDLSCYGQTNYQTPNLDRLAADGIRFTHYTGGADSAATTAQLLAGTISPLPDGEPNLAQRLQQNGYHTGLIGEWSLAGRPWARGFDEFAGFLEDAEGRNYYPDHVWRCAPKSIFNETNKTFDTFIGQEPIYANLGGKKARYLPDVLVLAMDNFVRINAPTPANHHRPLFLLVNFSAPRTATAGADDFPVPTDAPFTDESWPPAAKNRTALITRLDAGIGRLFEQLGKSGLTNNCVIFFTGSSAPGKFQTPRLNAFLPPEDFAAANHPAPRLPMLLWYPEKVRGGQTSDLPWRAADFPATALAISYSPPVTNFGGMAVLPRLPGR